MPDAKQCIGCGEVKPLDDYHRHQNKPDGRMSRCKTCRAESDRRYREKNRDKERERQRRYYEKNRDKELERARLYYAENRDKMLERDRRYYEKNRDKVRERHRRYYEENRDKVLENDRRYREENREYRNRMSNRNAAKRQDNTALTATRTGKPWTPAEDDILTADDGRTLFAKAILLGRTYRSCVSRRQHLARREVAA